MKRKKNSKFLLIGITFLLIAVMGSIWYTITKKEVAEPINEETKKEILKSQKELALYIVRNYKEVETIKFENYYTIEDTGTWHITAVINKENRLKFSVERFSSASEPRVGYNKQTFNLEPKNSEDKENLNGVEVIYLEDI